MDNLLNALPGNFEENLMTILPVIIGVLIFILILLIIFTVRSHKKNRYVESEQIFDETPANADEADDESNEEASDNESEDEPDEPEEEDGETIEEKPVENESEQPERFVLEESEQVHAKRFEKEPEEIPVMDEGEQESKTPEAIQEQAEETVEAISDNADKALETVSDTSELMPEQAPAEYQPKHVNRNQQYFDTLSDKLDTLSMETKSIKDITSMFNDRFDDNRDAFEELRRDFNELRKEMDYKVSSVGEQMHRRMHESTQYQALSEQINSLSQMTAHNQKMNQDYLESNNEAVQKICQNSIGSLSENINDLRSQLEDLPEHFAGASVQSEVDMTPVTELEDKLVKLGDRISNVQNAINRLNQVFDSRLKKLPSEDMIRNMIQNELGKDKQNFDMQSSETQEVSQSVSTKKSSEEVSKSQSGNVAKTSSEGDKNKDTNKNSTVKQPESKKQTAEPVSSQQEHSQSQSNSNSNTDGAKTKKTRSHRKATKQKQEVQKDISTSEERKTNRLEAESNLQSQYDEQINSSGMLVKDMEATNAEPLQSRPETWTAKQAKETNESVIAFQEKMRKRKERKERIEKEKALQAQNQVQEESDVIPSDGSNHYSSEQYHVNTEPELDEIEKADAIINNASQGSEIVQASARPSYSRPAEQTHQRRTPRPSRASYVSSRATRR